MVPSFDCCANSIARRGWNAHHLPPRLENKPSRVGGHRRSSDQTGIIGSNTCLLNFSAYAQCKARSTTLKQFPILEVLRDFTCARLGRGTLLKRACTHKIANGDSYLINVRLVCTLRNLSQTLPKVREVPHNRTADRYSITLSARASNIEGTVMPSASAVLRLITNSNLVGCSIGRSAGLAPRKSLTSCRLTSSPKI